MNNNLLLRKFLNGYCTPEELKEVDKLLQEPGGKKILDSLMEEQATKEWKSTTIDSSPEQVARWKMNMYDRIAASKPTTRQWISMHFLQYAAVGIGIIVVGAIAFLQLNKIPMNHLAFIEKTNEHGIPQVYILPDSSEVFLGAGSTLRYPENFNEDTREVQLQGEGFFQVKRNEEKPFIIQTGNIETRVLGTSFKVESFQGFPVEVSVATGKVSVRERIGKQINEVALLTRGMKVAWDSLSRKASSGTVDVYGLEQWKAGDIVLDEQTLEYVAEELQRRYNVEITIMDKETESHRVSGTFIKDQPVHKILGMLGLVGKFRFETTNNQSFKIYKLNQTEMR